MNLKPNKKSRYKQGYYKPLNPHKYLGDPNKIRYMSSWELKCAKHFDTSSSILYWNSEDVVIKYISPKDGLPHRYFIDFLIVTKNANGDKIVSLIEVKPEKEKYPPKKQGKKKSRYLQECLTYEINQAKWAAAREVCKKKGWNFVVMTEKNMNFL